MRWRVEIGAVCRRREIKAGRVMLRDTAPRFAAAKRSSSMLKVEVGRPTPVRFVAPWGAFGRCYVTHRRDGDRILFALGHVNPGRGLSHTNCIESVAPAMWRRYYPLEPFKSMVWLDAAWVPDQGGCLEVTRVAFPDDDQVEFSDSLEDIPEEFIEAIKTDIVGAFKARDTPLRRPRADTPEEGAARHELAEKIDAILRAKGVEPERMPQGTSVVDRRRNTKPFLVVDGT
jgi:hypothetical protein